MTLVTAQAPHITAHFVTSHRGCGGDRETMNKTKAIRRDACYYNIVVNAHRVTSMADTDTDAVRKQKKAEYDKQCRLKRKFLMQQQASTSSETELVRKQKKAEYDKQYRLKRKLLLQQQASKDIYMIRYFHP
jgi:hypothetical protein